MKRSTARMPPRSEENVSQSRPTRAMSSKRTTDQKPFSHGKPPSSLQ